MSLIATALLLDGNNNTNTSFRNWGSNVSAKILAAGMVKASDTGQIDFTTVQTPAALGTSQGYEIWQFNDTLQATAPVFFKLEYGSGAATADPGTWLTFGSGSNGSGTLTGSLSTRMSVNGTAAGATTWFFSGSNNRFMMAAMAAGANASSSTILILSFERTVDANGNVTSEGVLVVTKSKTTWGQVGWNTTTGAMTAVEASLGAMGPSVGSGSSGYATAIYPVFHTKGNFLNPGYNIICAYEANFSAGIPVTFPFYNVSHTYVPLTSAIASTPLTRGAAGSTVLLRFD